MRKEIRLIVGAHCHLPEGAGGKEFLRMYETRLKPFVTNLYKFPRIPAVLHYSGAVLSWIERNKPEMVSLLQGMVDRKQVELLGGGFYEPAMPLLPLSDRLGQVEMLTTYLRKSFGKRPAGCFIPADTWDHALVSLLCTCGMSYAFLDERLLRAAGLGERQRFRPCISEDRGKVLTLFPVFHAEAEAPGRLDDGAALARRTLEEVRGAVEPVVSLFPAFPDSAEAAEAAVYTFFEELAASEDLFEYTLPSRVYKTLKSLPKVYFPGTGAKNFLLSHPEANNIYAKTLFLHIMIDQIKGDKERKKSALEELWKAQTASLFRELPISSPDHRRLRESAYHALLTAERIARDDSFVPRVMDFDFDFDGEKECLFLGEEVNCYINIPHAALFELDALALPWNFQPALGERPEDTYSFVDTCGPDEPFELVELDKQRSRAVFRRGTAAEGGAGVRTLEKTFRQEGRCLAVRYKLEGSGRVEFGTRCRFTFLSGSSVRVNERPEAGGLLSMLEFQDLESEAVLRLTAAVPFAAQTTHEYDGSVYRATTVTLTLPPLNLDPSGQSEFTFTLEICG